MRYYITTLQHPSGDRMARKNVEKTYTDKRGKFAPGNPGKPKGARHKVTRAVEELLEGQAEDSYLALTTFENHLDCSLHL